MEVLSVASRKTPQAAGGQKYSNKLFLIYPKKSSFLEPLGNYCINWLLMLYYKHGVKMAWEARSRGGSNSFVEIQS